MSTEEEQGALSQVTPGQLLAAARERYGLTESDVAKQLRLSAQTIRNIEHDHYEAVGVRAFVRGYLCAYARVVHFPQERLMEVFDAMDATFQEVTPIASLSQPDAFSAVNKRKKPYLLWAGASAAVLVVLVVLIKNNHLPTTQLMAQSGKQAIVSVPTTVAVHAPTVSAKKVVDHLASKKPPVQSFQLVDAKKPSAK